MLSLTCPKNQDIIKDLYKVLPEKLGQVGLNGESRWYNSTFASVLKLKPQPTTELFETAVYAKVAS